MVGITCDWEPDLHKYYKVPGYGKCLLGCMYCGESWCENCRKMGIERQDRRMLHESATIYFCTIDKRKPRENADLWNSTRLNMDGERWDEFVAKKFGEIEAKITGHLAKGKPLNFLPRIWKDGTWRSDKLVFRKLTLDEEGYKAMMRHEQGKEGLTCYACESHKKEIDEP